MSETPEPHIPRVEEPEFLEAEPVPPPASARAGRGVSGPAPGPSGGDVRRAWIVALAADFVQWVLFPVFMGGTAVNAGVDLLVAFLLVRWMGWHLAFLPAFVTELVPIANFVPSWTLAMWIVTRMRGSKA
jgi:hypothetical protein